MSEEAELTLLALSKQADEIRRLKEELQRKDALINEINEHWRLDRLKLLEATHEK